MRLSVLALLALLLVVLFVVVDVVLGVRLRSDLRTRLTDRAALAVQLDGQLEDDELVTRLQGAGVVAELCDPDAGCVTSQAAPAPVGPGGTAPTGRLPGPGDDGTDGSADGVRGPAAGPAERAQVQQSGSVLYVRTGLADERLLTLSVDDSAVRDALSGLVVLEVIGGAAALGVAWVALGRVVGAALRPLDDMTALARRIAGGDRGRRLGSGRPDTELGRNAMAFDAMLDELESAVAAAELAQERMRAFLSDASHELRTPLAGFQANAENLLRADPGRLERERALAAMVRESTRASRLVGDLLTAARLTEGVDLQLGEVDLAELARQEVERQRVLAPAVEWAVAGAPRLAARADAVRLGQVLTNLLDNARRAVPAGGRVEVSLERASAGGTSGAGAAVAVLEVRDTGPGIPGADRERVFERFVRLDAARDRRSGGSGLGLAIARGFARAHGGDLVASDPGPAGGARLTLTLPLPPP